MRVETNSELVRRGRRFAQYLFFAGLAVIGASLFLTTSEEVARILFTNIIATFLFQIVLLGFVIALTGASVRMTNLWVREPRPENALRDGLKGLSNKSVLYNYYHLPARHVLIAPQGVFALHVLYQEGQFTVSADRWRSNKSAFGRLLSLIRRDDVGDPNADALRAAQHVRTLLQPIAPDVEVHPVVVVISPRAVMNFSADPAVPALYADDKRTPNLKDYMRTLGKEKRVSLTPQQISAFEEATVSKTKA